MKELKPGETITLTCDKHGQIAEGVTLDNLSQAEQNHREAFSCSAVIHTMIVVAGMVDMGEIAGVKLTYDKGTGNIFATPRR